MSRFQAFFIHLMISAFVVGVFLGITLLLWYPAPYFGVDGAHQVLLVLASVDVVLGPLLTLVIFKSGKPRLKLDLGIIAAIQISAFVYGATIILTERPAFVAYFDGRFTTIPASKVDAGKIASPDLAVSLFRQPQLVNVKLPDDQESVVKVIEEVFNGGTPVELRTEYYEPYANAAKTVLGAASPVETLPAVEEKNETVLKQISRVFPGDIGDLKYHRLIGKNKVMAMLLDPESGLPLGAVDLPE